VSPGPRRSQRARGIMHEMLHWAGGREAAIVMAKNVNRRARARPWIGVGPTTPTRCPSGTRAGCSSLESNQEVMDTIIMGLPRVRAPDVLLPAMVNMDAFHPLAHVRGRDVPDIKESTRSAPVRADGGSTPSNPSRSARSGAGQLLHGVALQDTATPWTSPPSGSRRSRAPSSGTSAAPGDLLDCYRHRGRGTRSWSRWGRWPPTGQAGRRQHAATRGHKVGLVRIRAFRPFPTADLREALKGAKVVGVMDRSPHLRHEAPCSPR